MTTATADLKAAATNVPSATLSATADSIRKLQAELNDLFPEREALITQLVYGLLTREHVLVFGRFGTGKSRLVERFFGAFTDANFFSVELTKFMTESNIVGIPNPKILREEGRIWHERKGTMLDAHFAELDELFDANDHLLRTLLGILNERRFNRGVQLERANLHMTLASTNADPEGEVKRSPTLGAVVDRFLFQTQVTYLTKDESRRRMYSKYLQDERPSVKISYPDVVALAEMVVHTPIEDPVLIELHNQIVQEYQKKKKVVFSDRRACQALKLVKANALLFGREEVGPDDFLAVMWAFCNGHDTAAQDEFKAVATPIIEKVVKDRQPDMVRTQMKLLDELEKRMPKPIAKNGSAKGGNNGSANGNGTHSADELVTMRRSLIQLQTDVRDIKPNHPSIEDRRKQLLVSIEGMKGDVGKLIDGEVGK